MVQKMYQAIGLTSILLLAGAGCGTTQETTVNTIPAPAASEVTPAQPAPATSPTSSSDTSVLPAPSASAPAVEVKTETKTQAEVKTETTPAKQPVTQPVVKPEEKPAAPKPAVKSFSIIAKNWVFEPSTITVKKGDTVKLSIKSIDVDHGFSLSAFNINKQLKPGQTTTAEFVADKTGSFTFFCSVFCGSGHSGMRGTLVVEE